MASKDVPEISMSGRNRSILKPVASEMRPGMLGSCGCRGIAVACSRLAVHNAFPAQFRNSPDRMEAHALYDPLFGLPLGRAKLHFFGDCGGLAMIRQVIAPVVAAYAFPPWPAPPR